MTIARVAADPRNASVPMAGCPTHDGPAVGHLFVVRGRIETVVHDAAVVPTDDDFDVRRYWRPLVGDEVSAVRPLEWPVPAGHARANGRSGLVFVSVGSSSRLSLADLLTRAEASVREAAVGVVLQKNRIKPLIAVPVLGIDGGGHGAERGEVVRSLIETLAATAIDIDVDIALVTPDDSVYAAAQHIRRESFPVDGQIRASAESVAQLARSGSLALFLGAGVSIPAGLPTWDELLQALAREAKIEEGSLAGLAPLDQAELIEKKLPTYRRSVARLVRQHERPALSHCLLAALDCREVVTTNYDRLYETAVEASGRKTATVLPRHPAVGAASWILKMHGDAEHKKSIVLTRRQFVRFDATTRPAGALLQSIIMTRHLLLVGASLNDDNVVRLAHEVQAYREAHKLKGPFGSLLDVNDDRGRRELWSGQLEWLTMPGSSVAERARELEIFLDAVACLASTDQSWLLDARFQGLLDRKDRVIAKRARDLRDELRGRARFAGLLSDLDARGGGTPHKSS